MTLDKHNKYVNAAKVMKKAGFKNAQKLIMIEASKQYVNEQK
tara:strand:+ start:812 stop:937 length:126 start_codon:yes stop_codon:yes gene_type:complete